MKISIVIPLYNVEQYVERCLYSCINQKDIHLGIDYEIICVNDGTKDKSAELAKTIAKTVPYGIMVVDQDNQGLSAARNKGLSLAKGEYVWFVDSDDWIESDSLYYILPQLSNDLDVLLIQQKKVYERDISVKQDEVVSIPRNISGIEMMKKGCYPTMAQRSIYRRLFLIQNNLYFYEGIYHEDTEFMPRVLYYAQTICSLDRVVYNYFQRIKGSITSDYKLKNGIDILKVCDSLYQFSKDFECDLVNAYANRISQIIYHHLKCIKYLSGEDKKILFSDMVRHRYIYKYMVNHSNIKYKLIGVILCLNVRLASYLVRLDVRQ